MSLPAPPQPEPPCITDLTGLAPKFRDALIDTLADLVHAGWRPRIRESLRTDERQQWLYGFGREYDDGRGIVTNAPTAESGWHFYGLATDVGDRRYEDGQEPPEFYTALAECAARHGLVTGAKWHVGQGGDRDHVQWGAMAQSPHEAPALYAAGGLQAVWQAVGAG